MENNYSKSLTFLFALVLGLAMVSCGSKKKIIDIDPSKEVDLGYTTTKSYNNAGSSSSVEVNKGNPSNLTLLDLLRRVSGVTIMGQEGNARVKVRGASSFNSGTDPLFIVDGVPLGTSYNLVSNAINPNEVKSIRALSGPDATLYGARGANGVILIKMKNKK